jgi:hypothetical protein
VGRDRLRHLHLPALAEPEGLEDEFTNGLGQDVRIDKRSDLELNKVKLELKGWMLDPRFQYVLYTWTNQAAMGLGAQVVVAGNLNWASAFTSPSARKTGSRSPTKKTSTTPRSGCRTARSSSRPARWPRA